MAKSLKTFKVKLPAVYTWSDIKATDGLEMPPPRNVSHTSYPRGTERSFGDTTEQSLYYLDNKLRDFDKREVTSHTITPSPTCQFTDACGCPTCQPKQWPSLNQALKEKEVEVDIPKFEIPKPLPKCIDCTHRIPDIVGLEFSRCAMYEYTRMDYSGLDTSKSSQYFCTVSRKYKELCGPEGKSFQQKTEETPTPQRSWWHKLLIKMGL